MSKTQIPQLQTSVQSQTHSQDDAIDLRELANAIWKGKLLILGVTLVFVLGSVFYALLIPNEYKSTAILSPASTSSSSSLSNLAGRFGGLASLAGVNLGGASGGNKTTIAIALIKTWGFLETFIKNNQLEVEVFATKGWSKTNNKLLIDKTLYDEENTKWVLGGGGEAGVLGPTSWELFGHIKDRINISQNLNTGLITLSVEHYSPFVAKKWVDLLIIAINQHMQLQDRVEALNSIEYLKEQINKTNISEMRTIFYQLIEEQTKTLMLAEISSEYVFKTLSPSKIAEQKSKPKRALIVVLGLIFGLVFSMVVVLVRFFIK
ncbi:Wzz/FepE/Etk N-terminal domain-containing protein [uncultured Paraglaciecola sp.]|uniref:Wzz/FepE/Etk N-terminal domain-containing protein n=1 Tax=uncultured Paraglaciecola sp. TaxID=1765024 RepID=UPI0025CBAC26|nr:Wzz/FepE/Etk N-terminal domain-containing protein [uncultured Paraglaciecola sp.]